MVGFRDGKALLMPFGTLDGIGLGCKTEIAEPQPPSAPIDAWLGRVVNALGEPIDGKGPLPQGDPPSRSATRRRRRMRASACRANSISACARSTPS